MLSIKNIRLGFGKKTILDKVSLQLYKGQRVGIVGQNGCGKTSFFQLILQEIHQEEGEIDLPNHTIISYVEQEITNPNMPIIDYVTHAHPLYIGDHSDLPEYYQIEPMAKKLLVNLGFLVTDLERPLAEFSGGWQMRANLAKALIVPSDLLLLDEPTNHLDLETVVWLESWLNNYPGLALVISHDREFLDNVTTDTVAIYSHKLNLFGGNYSKYEATRVEQERLAAKTQAKTQAKVADLQKFVDRFKAKASKAKQAQSKMKMIEKMQISNIINTERDYNIEFLEPEYTSDKLLSIENANIGYPDKLLINHANLQLFAGDRVGLLGKNGKGKTSLIKAIIDGDSLLSGHIHTNPKIKIGYFAQHSVDQLNINDTPFNYIQDIVPNMTTQEVSNYLGKFGFSYDDGKKNLEIFSGGEKSRLVLAGIILTRPNILFLDEPTNHLDMMMREELAQGLQEYEGAVILVSHDKFLLQSVAEDLYLIDDHKLQHFAGDLEEYYKYLLSNNDDGSNKNKQKSSNNNNNRKEISKLKNEINKIDKNIKKAQAQIAKLQEELLSSSSTARYNELNKILSEIQSNLDSDELTWLSLTEDLEKLNTN